MLPLKWFLRVVAPQFWRSGKNFIALNQAVLAPSTSTTTHPLFRSFIERRGTRQGTAGCRPSQRGRPPSWLWRGKSTKASPLRATEPGSLTTASSLPPTPFITPRTRCPQPGHRHRALSPPPQHWGEEPRAQPFHRTCRALMAAPEPPWQRARASRPSQPLIVPHSKNLTAPLHRHGARLAPSLGQCRR